MIDSIGANLLKTGCLMRPGKRTYDSDGNLNQLTILPKLHI